MLDRAEALRAKRRAALAQLDSLTQSLFLDLFGDPLPKTRSVPLNVLADANGLVWQRHRHPPGIQRPCRIAVLGSYNAATIRWAEAIDSARRKFISNFKRATFPETCSHQWDMWSLRVGAIGISLAIITKIFPELSCPSDTLIRFLPICDWLTQRILSLSTLIAYIRQFSQNSRRTLSGL